MFRTFSNSDDDCAAVKVLIHMITLGYQHIVQHLPKCFDLFPDTPEVTNKNAFRDQEVVIGSRVELNCIAIGNPETKYYIWRSQNGSVIQNKTDGRLEFSSVQSSDGGRLSCAGGSEIGEGKKEYINLFVRGNTSVSKMG